MSKPDDSTLQAERNMDDIGRLIRHAGARDNVPPERAEHARARVRAHWEQVIAETRQQRSGERRRYFAAAASVALVIAGATLYLRSGRAPEPVVMASVDRVLGTVFVADRAVAAGDVIAPGAHIRTADDSRIALRLAGGQSLRVDTSTDVIVLAANRVELAGGGVYIDTEQTPDTDPVVVTTPLGQARDVGTQFQVRLAAGILTVGVREGSVEVTRPDWETVSIDSGRIVDLPASGVATERPVAQDDPIWDWVESVAPPFDIEGATLEQYLRWYARQRGLRLAWSELASEQNAMRIELSGSIEGLSLEDGFRTVQRIARFEHRLDGDTLWVSVE